MMKTTAMEKEEEIPGMNCGTRPYWERAESRSSGGDLSSPPQLLSSSTPTPHPLLCSIALVLVLVIPISAGPFLLPCLVGCVSNSFSLFP